MNFIVLVALACVAAASAKPGGDFYTDKWDNIDLDEICDKKRIMKSYSDCMLNKGRCTPEGNDLKETLPDALQNECSKCTEKQKEGSNKIIGCLVNKYPELWKELAAKYDPENIYQEKYKDRIDAARSAA